jgi:hypothetical protein
LTKLIGLGTRAHCRQHPAGHAQPLGILFHGVPDTDDRRFVVLKQHLHAAATGQGLLERPRRNDVAAKVHRVEDRPIALDLALVVGLPLD